MKKIQIDLHFHLPQILILKNPYFKIPYQQLLIILSFMNTIFESN